MSVCAVDGCDSKSRANGLCNKHLMRMRNTGTTDPGSKARGPIEDRFGKLFEKRKPNDCWLWRGDVNHNGYGRIAVGAKSEGSVLAHRVAWEIANGPMPKGIWVVMHKCDTPACVNPAHLKLGTQTDNLADMRAKNRGYRGFDVQPIRGEDHHDCRFTEADVMLIRAAKGGLKALADRYGVNRTSIIKIRSRKTWKHID